MRERLTRVFGAQVRNSYGASEFLPIAWECAHGHLHVNEDWVLLEPVGVLPRGLGVRSGGRLPNREDSQRG